VQARAKFIDENGGRSFFDYSVPQAVISLKKASAASSRSRTDRGVIAILDHASAQNPTAAISFKFAANADHIRSYGRRNNARDRTRDIICLCLVSTRL